MKGLTETQRWFLLEGIVERDASGELTKAGFHRPYGLQAGEGEVLSGLIRRGWLRWRRRNWLETTKEGKDALRNDGSLPL